MRRMTFSAAAHRLLFYLKYINTYSMCCGKGTAQLVHVHEDGLRRQKDSLMTMRKKNPLIGINLEFALEFGRRLVLVERVRLDKLG